jgi:hypothetical protein
LWAYYDRGGFSHVAAFLRERDISTFDAKAPPPKTAAFWVIVDANLPAEESELADILDELNRDAVTLQMLQNRAQGSFADWLRERKNRRAIPHRLEKCGFVPVRNPTANDGLWKIYGKRQAVYVKAALSPREQIEAADKIS